MKAKFYLFPFLLALGLGPRGVFRPRLEGIDVISLDLDIFLFQEPAKHR